MPSIMPIRELGPARSTAMSSEWPLQSYLELAALPGAVPCARLHARQILWEWGQAALAEAAELLVSELITNAVQASSDAAAGQPGAASPDRVPTVRFWLAADRHQVLIQVWDGCRREPQLQDPAPEAESGRGLLLVEALGARWGSQVLNGRAGKVVWALVSRAG
jgi:anti-sigma regulatory factor (Ser/Thr protein kinase)